MTDPGFAAGAEAGRPEQQPRLPSVYLEEIFQQAMLDDLVMDIDPVPRPGRPELLLVVAQPGAGAAVAHLQWIQYHVHLAGIAREGEHPGGIVSVDLESLRMYHPDYERFRMQSPQALVDNTEADALWWENRATDYLMAQHYNVLVEREWSSADAAILTAERFASHGYDVHVAAVAVPAAMSRLAIVESFVRQAEVAGTGRWISPERHDAAYDLTEELVDRAEASAAVTRVSVHTRDGVIHDKSRDSGGRWPPQARPGIDALAEAREVILTRPERTALANRLAMNLERLAQVGVVHTALYEMGADIAQDLTPHPHGLPGHVASDLVGAMGDLAAANAALDAVTDPADPEPSGPGAGPGPGPDLEPPPPPPEPDLGPDL